MTKTQHTPGPWHTMAVGSHWVALEMPPRAGQHIALMTELPNAEANARLIAAAPELLAALQSRGGMMAEKRIRLTVLMLNAAGDALWDVLTLLYVDSAAERLFVHM